LPIAEEIAGAPLNVSSLREAAEMRAANASRDAKSVEERGVSSVRELAGAPPRGAAGEAAG
jgi:hypothetical protein